MGDRFQFLIGSLKTRESKEQKRAEYGVSIPHR